jgi:UDP-GlcNAc3NAcA epimerase
VNVLSVVGARPQFIKAAVLSEELARRGIPEVLVHTGQHYDASMSDVFFEELPIPKPSYELGVGSANHGAQTGLMMERLEPVVIAENPDWLVVYGDTNSTLAAALVGAKLHVPVAHVEAGLRSFNRSMPEEINRIVADHVATLLLVPNQRAARQLGCEGIKDGVAVVGDLMVDLAERIAMELPERPKILERFRLQPYDYGVATIHRASNTDDSATFAKIVDGLRRAELPIIFPVHPRTREALRTLGKCAENVLLCEPLPYSETIALVARSAVVFTDSGGVQKEAFVLRVPCVTLREETEWTETLENGWNVLAGSDPERIAAGARRPVPPFRSRPYGDGDAASAIVDALLASSAASSNTLANAAARSLVAKRPAGGSTSYAPVT